MGGRKMIATVIVCTLLAAVLYGVNETYETFESLR